VRLSVPLLVLATGGVFGCGEGAFEGVSDQRAALSGDAAWATVGAMGVARNLHTATLLPGGEVLIVGGEGGGEVHASAERFDPDTGQWQAAASTNDARFQHTEALLSDGRVLVLGGYGYGQYLGLAALYDPAEDAWTDAAPMGAARLANGTTRLPSGAVLVTGEVAGVFLRKPPTT
jgi:hypothetical protein